MQNSTIFHAWVNKAVKLHICIFVMLTFLDQQMGTHNDDDDENLIIIGYNEHFSNK